MVFLKGFLLGLSLIIFIGPVFFTLLKSSLNYGFKAGWWVAIGIIVSDVICVAICYAGAVPFFQNINNQFWIALAGAFILLCMGLKYILSPNLNTGKEIQLKAKDYLSFFTKGFLVNFVNPFVFLVWIGIITFAEEEYGTDAELFIFLTAVLLGIFATDSLKAAFAHKLKPIIRPDILPKVYKAIGVLLLLFAGRLLWYAFYTV